MELFKLPDDGWYNIAIPGEFPHSESGTVQVLDEDGMRCMAGEIHGFAADAAWPGILVDFDHQSLDIDKPSTAAGWIVDAEYRPTGLWAKIRWTSKGREALEGGLFRFISPVWCVSDCEELGDKRLRPRHLMNCAVTNCPNIRGMVPLSNRDAGEKRWAAPARPLGLVAVTPAARPSRASWCGLANRRRLTTGLGVLANAFMSDEQRKAYWARRVSGTSATSGSSSSGFVNTQGDPKAAASAVVSEIRGGATGSEDHSANYDDAELSRVAGIFRITGKNGDYSAAAAARLKDLLGQRQALADSKLSAPEPFLKGRLNMQDVRREAIAHGLDLLAETVAAKEHNREYSKYLREQRLVKKKYRGKAGLQEALARFDASWDKSYREQSNFVEKFNASLDEQVSKIDTEISKLTQSERVRVEKEDVKAAEEAAKAEAKAQKEADRLERERERYARRKEADAKKAEAEAAAAIARAEAEKAKAEAQAKAAAERADREQAKAQAKAKSEADRQAKQSLLDRLSASKGFADQPRELRQQILKIVKGASPEEVVMYEDKLKPLLNRCDMGAYVLKNAMSEEQRKAMFAKMSGLGSGRVSPTQIIDTSKPGYFTVQPGNFTTPGWGMAPTLENLLDLQWDLHEANLQSAYEALGTQTASGAASAAASSAASPAASTSDVSVKTSGGSGGWLNISLDDALSRLDTVSGASSGVLANAAGPMSDAQRRAMFAKMSNGDGSPGARNPYALDDRYRYAFESEEGFEALDRYLDGLGIDWSGPQMTRDEFKKAYNLFDKCNLDNIVSYTRYEQRMNGINSRSDALSDLSSLFDGIHSRMNESEWKRQHGV